MVERRWKRTELKIERHEVTTLAIPGGIALRCARCVQCPALVSLPEASRMLDLPAEPLLDLLAAQVLRGLAGPGGTFLCLAAIVDHFFPSGPQGGPVRLP